MFDINEFAYGDPNLPNHYAVFLHPVIECFYSQPYSELFFPGSTFSADEIRKKGPILRYPDGRYLVDPFWVAASVSLGELPEDEIYQGPKNIIAILKTILLHNPDFLESDELSLAIVAARLYQLKDDPTEEDLGDISIKELANLFHIDEKALKRVSKVTSKGCDKLIDALESRKIPLSTALIIAKLSEKDQWVLFTNYIDWSIYDLEENYS